MRSNYYIDNVTEIAKMGIERKLTWTVVVDVWDQEHPGEAAAYGDIGEQRTEFYAYIEGRRYAADGTEIMEG